MVQTRRRRSVAKKRRARVAKRAKKLGTTHDVQPDSAPGEDSAARRVMVATPPAIEP
jgi:hypothetical protein